MNGSKVVILLMALAGGQGIMASPQDEYNALKAGLDTINSVAEKMRLEINNQMRINDLQQIIDEIDKLMLGYRGTARKHLDEMRRLNSAARLKFSNARGPLIEMCAALNSTLPVITGSAADTDEARHIVWKGAILSIASSVKNTNKTIANFQEAKELRGELYELLDRMEQDVKADYGPDGIFNKDVAKNSASAIPSIIMYLVFLLSSVKCALANASHTSRVERAAKIDAENEAALLLKIEAAKSIAPIAADLAYARPSLDTLSQLISQADRNQRVLLGDSPLLQQQLHDSLLTLGRECQQWQKA
ncbi:hypothetical protein KR067_002601 [Drosophila pandora]|nr:hypothetical protein KR067_002601 [Drosophila pandora]